MVKARAIDKGIIKELNFEVNSTCIDRAKKRINILTIDIEHVESEIEDVIGKDLEIERSYKLVKSVTGIVLVNAVKFKLITRVFATVKRGTPYVKLRKAG